jgi:hypothetical protein
MKNKRKIVVDASVAQAAGNASLHPVSANCRAALLATEDFFAVFCPNLTREWTNHESAFSRSWRIKMIQQGRVKFITEDVEIEEFLIHIEESTAEDSAKLAMEKDAHLVSASIMSDKIILALDEKVRKLFSKHCIDYKKIRNLLWSNPTKENDETINWLKRGAKSENDYSLLEFSRRNN